MAYQIEQNSVEPLMFLMVSSVDHITGMPGLAPVVTIRKPGGAFVAPAGAVSNLGNGWYQVAGNVTDSNTLGPLLLHATAAGCDPTDSTFDVVPVHSAAPPAIISIPTLIGEMAGSPKRTRTAEGTVEERSIADLILADRYANPPPDAVPWGMRIARTKPPSTTSS